MFSLFKAGFRDELDAIREAGTYKDERVISSPQSAAIRVPQGEVINFCANNYLGLADNPEIIAAAQQALSTSAASAWRRCASSAAPRTSTRSSRAPISDFLGTEDTILYSSCFDANGGLFETLLGAEDAIISDQLNHASIIDGIRLCKAERFRYANSDMADLEEILKKTQGHRRRLIATDGVFSMDGYLAKLDEICDLAEKYDAMVMVDDSHATGFIGRTGRGTPEHCGVLGRVDIITSTLGKALGGASGGFTTGRQEIVDLLRQRSRPYLFSNTLTPSLTAAGDRGLRDALRHHRAARQARWTTRGTSAEARDRSASTSTPASTAIVPIMLDDAKLAPDIADEMLERGHLRHRLLLPGGAQGPGADPDPDLGRPRDRAPRSGGGGVRNRRETTRSDLICPEHSD